MQGFFRDPVHDEFGGGGSGGWEDGHTVRKHRVAPAVIDNGIP